METHYLTHTGALAATAGSSTSAGLSLGNVNAEELSRKELLQQRHYSLFRELQLMSGELPQYVYRADIISCRSCNTGNNSITCCDLSFQKVSTEASLRVTLEPGQLVTGWHRLWNCAGFERHPSDGREIAFWNTKSCSQHAARLVICLFPLQISFLGALKNLGHFFLFSESVLELNRRQKERKEALLSSGQSPTLVALAHQKEREELEKVHQEELHRVDMKIITKLDQCVSDQQVTLEKAGVPGFFVTNSPMEISLQMCLLQFITRLAHSWTVVKHFGRNELL